MADQRDVYGNQIRRTDADLYDEFGNQIRRTDAELYDEFGNQIRRTDVEYGNPDLRDEYYDPIRRTDEYGYPDSRDEYGNRIRRTDEYGNQTSYMNAPSAAPVHGGMTATGHNTGDVYGTGVPATGKERHGISGMLHRSGSSSSSSSSEDDGHGGRRKKKGLKEKIKEKLPGSHKTTETGYHGEREHEKKGFMEKIKEKLPGHHH